MAGTYSIWAHFKIVVEIHEWLKAKGIDHLYEHFEKHEIDGEALNELKQHLQLPTFPAFLQQLGLVKVGEMLKLSAALRKL